MKRILPGRPYYFIPLVLSFNILLFQNALAQQVTGVIRGVVLSPDNSPLPGASVAIAGKLHKTITAADGTFLMKRVNAGAYTLTISHVNFTTQHEKIHLPTGDTLSLSITLKSSMVRDIRDVTITGKTAAQQLKASPLPVEVIDLSKMHGQNGNLMSLLNRAPGVKIRTDGAIGDPVNVNLNGLDGKAIVLFKDGIPLSFYGHAFDPSLLPANLLSRVEIYKGALPVSLGADALGGALNFISYYPSHKTVDVSYETGSFNTHRATLSAYVPGKDNKSYVGLNAAYTYSDNNYRIDIGKEEEHASGNFIYDNTNRKRVKNNQVRAPMAELYAGVRDRKWADELRLTLIGSQFLKHLPKPPGMWIPSLTGLHTFADDRTFSTMLKYKKNFFHKKLGVETMIGYSNSSVAFMDTSTLVYDRYGDLLGESPGGRGELSNKGNALRLKYDFYTVRFFATYDLHPDHQLQFNHIFTHNKRSGTDSLGGLDRFGNDVYKTPAVYIRNISALGLRSRFFNSKLENLAALKHYFMNTTGYSTYGMGGNEHLAGDSTGSWGWMEGLSYHPSQRWIWKASYEYATRLPDDAEIFGDSYGIKSNFDIQPEHSHNFNLQVQYSTIAKEAGALTLSAGFFSRTTDARIMLVRDIPYSYYKNRNIITSRGIEMDISYRPFKFFLLTANGTYMDVKEDTSPEVPGSKPLRIGNMPPILGNVQARFLFDNLLHPKSRTEIYGYWNYIHRFNLHSSGSEIAFGLFEHFPEDYPNRQFWIPGDNRLGQQLYTAGMIHYLEKPKCSIALECNNVADEKLFDNWNIQRPARSFSVKLRWELFPKRAI